MITIRLLFSLVLALVSGTFFLLSGCSTFKPVDNLRQQSHWHQGKLNVIHTAMFPLQTVEQFSHHSPTLRVYIEGDGRAWHRKRPSVDPSPRQLVMLTMMFADPFPDKLYLARPCQFIKGNRCTLAWWTDKRYSQPVFDSLNQALNQIKQQGRWQRFELVGYSGGATLALLLAGKRNDVVSVRTIAGNLAPRFADRLHGLIPSVDALEPLRYARRLQAIPQWHFVGEKDTIVPIAIVRHYMQGLALSDCVRYTLVPHASHAQGWLAVWPALLKQPFSCD